MTCEPHTQAFRHVFPISTLVMVDMRRANLRSARGLQRSAAAGILTNCRTALAFARRIGMPVAYVSGSGYPDETTSSNEWIKGFEPQRMDPFYERRTVSCYSSPYFADGLRESCGSAVLAGFLGNGGCLSTGADALLCGHRLTILSDATIDDVSDRAFDGSAIRLLRAFTSFDIRVCPTSIWTRSVTTSSVS